MVSTSPSPYCLLAPCRAPGTEAPGAAEDEALRPEPRWELRSMLCSAQHACHFV